MKKRLFIIILLVFIVTLVGCSAADHSGNWYKGGYIYHDAAPENLGEEYLGIAENPFVKTTKDATSTFSLDTSTAGYANLRRLINKGQTISKDHVKLEEMVNYFSYNYEDPEGDNELSISSEIMDCPWNLEHKLVSIGVKAKPMEQVNTKNNIVLLLDVSGSMADPNKLPLMQAAFKLFVDTLNDDDTVSIVTYASSDRIALRGAKGSEKKLIVNILEDLMAGGSTAGSKGIQTAYSIAQQYFIEGGNNRVILGTDGDFNVGISSVSSLENFIAEKRETGIYLSVLGFGYGNYKDNKLATLSQAGNGNHAYIDSITEARKVLVEEIGGTLNIVAKDVKTQVTFNPRYVKEYRLLGYENKLLTDEEFEDETTDAGEIGAGHTTTAVYELVLNTDETIPSTLNDSWLQTVIRYKLPENGESKEIVKSVNETSEHATPSEDILFISAVLETGIFLRNSPYKGNASLEAALTRLNQLTTIANDEYKQEFITLVQKLKNRD